MQSKKENILTCSDKLKRFKQKIVFWKIELKQGSLEMFLRSNYKNKQFVLVLAQEHFTLSEQKYDHYFFCK